MIEQGWVPARAVVAVRATSDAAGSRELCTVDVGVTLLALLGSGMKIHVRQLGLQVRRFVAVNTGYRSVCPYQCERSVRMVEARQLFP
jgi:hypothetical protein